MKNLLQLYAVLVSVISALILMVSITFTLMGVLDIFCLDYKFATELMNYETDDDYIRHQTRECKENYGYSNNLELRMNSCLDKINSAERLMDKQRYIKSVINSAYSTIINGCMWVIVSFIFLLIHWKLSKKYNLNNVEEVI